MVQRKMGPLNSSYLSNMASTCDPPQVVLVVLCWMKTLVEDQSGVSFILHVVVLNIHVFPLLNY